MSVKSLTVVLDDEGQEICVLSRTLDGYLTGHGEELKRFLRGHIISRQFRSNDHRKVAVSMGHLAMLLIKEFRWGIGFFELQPCGTRQQGEEYVYTVYPRHNSPNVPSILNLKVETYFPIQTGNDLPKQYTPTVLYDGLLDEFNANEVQSQWECCDDAVDSFVDREVELATAAEAS